MYRLCFQASGPRSGRGYHPLAVPPVASGGVVPYPAHQPLWLQVVPAAPQPHPDAGLHKCQSGSSRGLRQEGVASPCEAVCNRHG